MVCLVMSGKWKGNRRCGGFWFSEGTGTMICIKKRQP